MRKKFPILAAFALLLGFAPRVWAYYDFSATTSNGITLYYQFVEDGVQVRCPGDDIAWWAYSGFDRPVGDLEIPESVTYDDVTYAVVSIGDVAFYSCTGLTSVTIPNSVVSIGGRAF